MPPRSAKQIVATYVVGFTTATATTVLLALVLRIVWLLGTGKLDHMVMSLVGGQTTLGP